MPKKEASFEKDLEELERIVEALEEGGLPLDDSLKRFEQGIKLVRRCEGALGAAEKRIEILTKNANGEVEAKPFGEGEAEEAVTGNTPPSAGEDISEEPEEEGELLF